MVKKQGSFFERNWKALLIIGILVLLYCKFVGINPIPNAVQTVQNIAPPSELSDNELDNRASNIVHSAYSTMGPDDCKYDTIKKDFYLVDKRPYTCQFLFPITDTMRYTYKVTFSCERIIKDDLGLPKSKIEQYAVDSYICIEKKTGNQFPYCPSDRALELEQSQAKT